MSQSVIKLVDIALIPAALMVIGKLVGLWVTISLFELPWALRQTPDSIFSVRPVLAGDDIIIASSYSDLFMYLLLSFGFTFVLIRATHFHDTHISPNLLIRLVNNNLLGLVKSSFDIYHSASVWLIFIWIANLVVFINTILDKTYSWIFWTVFICNIIFTALLLQDVYREIDINRRNLGKQNAF